MKTKARIILLGLVMAITFCYVNSVRAETNFATGAAAQSGGAGASVNLDFEIIIPRFILFRVGTSGAVIDQIQFAPAADEVANATPGITGTGGDLGGSTVTASLISNAGGVTITETNNGVTGLGDGTGNFISYGQIDTATNDGNLPAPVLSDAGSNSVSITPNINAAVTNILTQWTYTYNNPGVPPAPGTYGGAANGGRVTYTAAIP